MIARMIDRLCLVIVVPWLLGAIAGLFIASIGYAFVPDLPAPVWFQLAVRIWIASAGPLVLSCVWLALRT